MSLQNLYFRFEVDHVIAEKHDGPTTYENLCLSCMRCNRYKGSDIASYDWENQKIIALFNPRTMSWDDHFEHMKGWLHGRSDTGKVTIRLLKFNSPDRIEERRLFSLAQEYPCQPFTSPLETT